MKKDEKLINGWLAPSYLTAKYSYWILGRL